MYTPSLEEIKDKLEVGQAYFPLAVALDLDHALWFPLYKYVSAGLSYHALLESGRSGRYSFMAYQPAYKLVAQAGQLKVELLDEEGKVGETLVMSGHILASLQEWMNARKAPRFEQLPDFQGGILGYLSYDLVREFESLPAKSNDDIQSPDFYFLGFEQVLAYDHHTKQLWLLIYQRIVENYVEESYRLAMERLKGWQEEVEQILLRLEREQEKGVLAGLAQTVTGQDCVEESAVETSFSESGFIDAVKRVQAYIAVGDVTQVNLSVRQSCPLEAEPISIYECLRELNPSPYMGYLHYPELQVISASPEQLVKVEGNKVHTRPIGGTRPRGRNRAEDHKLAQELLANEKERTEHRILVDLVRYDLGKVCTVGSVEVNEWMVLEEYSHVMHIVSNIRGELEQEMGCFEVIKAVFPGGTITGAPKVRTMEIIEELEPVRRGVYTGSIGWIDYTGDLELNIVIRTMLVQEEQVYVQAGAGIVRESVPHEEYRECLMKAEALWRAYELSREKRPVESREESN